MSPWAPGICGRDVPWVGTLYHPPFGVMTAHAVIHGAVRTDNCQCAANCGRECPETNTLLSRCVP